MEDREMCEGKGKCGSMCGSVDGAIHCHKNRLFKKSFALIALLFMFWVGLQLGELRTLTRMQDAREYGNSYKMMGGNVMWSANQIQTSTGSAEKAVLPVIK